MASVTLSNFGLYTPGGNSSVSDSATWRVFTPTVADTITWTSGPNDVDGATLIAPAPVTEVKFNFPPPALGVPKARTLTGITYSDKGTSGTVAVTLGLGNSGSVPGSLWGTNYKCSWALNISVTAGKGPAVSYDIQAEADDPITLHRDVFADNTAGITSLYLPVAMDGLTHPARGSGGMSVTYVTTAGRIELVNLKSSGPDVSVTSDEPGFLRIYVINDPNENPMARGYQPYSLSALRGMLAAKMKGGVQNSPILLGLLLENIPVPTVEIAGGGVVAEIHIISRLTEAGGAERDEHQRQKQERYS